MLIAARYSSLVNFFIQILKKNRQWYKKTDDLLNNAI